MASTNGDNVSRGWPGLIAALVAAAAVAAGAADAPPASAPPNPYRTVEGWAKMPAGRAWGATSAVDVQVEQAAPRVGDFVAVDEPLF